MLTELTFLSAFLAGLLGTTHCLGMCVSIAGTLSLCLPSKIHQTPFRFWSYLLTYNVGRISSYVVAGMLISFVSTQFLQTFSLNHSHPSIHWLSGFIMIALGLHLGKWWQGLTFLEKIGAFFWRRLEPIGRRLIPVKHLSQALGFGLVWGWLPCGLVYSVLALSLTSGSVWQGGLLMLAFGLGTLPMSLILGATTPWLTRLARKPFIYQLVGILIIGFGLFLLISSFESEGSTAM